MYNYIEMRGNWQSLACSPPSLAINSNMAEKGVDVDGLDESIVQRWRGG